MATDISRLKKQLKEKDRSLRASAAEELADIETPEAINALLETLNEEKDPYIIELLIRLLGEAGASEAVSVIITLLNHEDEDVVEQCLDALSDLADEENAIDIFLSLDELERNVDDMQLRNNIQNHIEHVLPFLRTFIIESRNRIKELENKVVQLQKELQKVKKTKK
ncbi:MAG: HEAT repeat domain-containing protein [Candidatus Coatesbacteria bacterium]|nr:HEAT repeat domain-containing protein [Candidatus Coatesbacteria bacterium]